MQRQTPHEHRPRIPRARPTRAQVPGAGAASVGLIGAKLPPQEKVQMHDTMIKSINKPTDGGDWRQVCVCESITKKENGGAT